MTIAMTHEDPSLKISSKTPFRTRQAPSPTGYLHIGSLRQMLFSRLFAIINHGIFYVRLEDTDRTRLVADSAKEICKCLNMLGLEPDEGITLQKTDRYSSFYDIYQKGPFNPYIQSERLKIYHQHCQNLLDKKLAYWSYLTTEQKEELQEIKTATKQPINYYTQNLEQYPNKNLEQSVVDGLADPLKPVLMYKLQRNQKVEVEDLLLGKTSFDLALEEDFTILKSDGYPTYHLAHLVDDHLMQTSLVIRAQEWYPSLAKHWTMFADYWNQVPQYLHLPFILGETGNKKLSKRDGSVRTMDYLQNGYLPESIINYLAFLGWNPGTEKELYLDQSDFEIQDNQPIETIIQKRLQKLLLNLSADFSLDKISKSPARFNLEKLNWFNRQYIKMMSLDEYCYRVDKNRLDKRVEGNYRIGDYVYLVDVAKNLVYRQLTENRQKENNPIGGGRGDLDWKTNLQAEVNEETNGQLLIDFDKLIYIGCAQTYTPNYTRTDEPGKVYDGKEFNIYFYEVNEADLQPYTEDVDGHICTFGWADLTETIYESRIFTAPIWHEFALTNKIANKIEGLNIKPDPRMVAKILDKNRATTLGEVQLESQCITNYVAPTKEQLQWKKISLDDSLANLAEIWAIIQPWFEEIGDQQNHFYNTVFNKTKTSKTPEEQFTDLATTWETKTKTWLKENGKQAGDYLWPLRIALSGLEKSPSPFELLAILNKDEVKRRVEHFLLFNPPQNKIKKPFIQNNEGNKTSLI